MDNLTHGLLGYGVYALLKKPKMERHKKWYGFAAIVAAELPDLDSFIFNDDIAYLRVHRGITHSLLVSPLMAAVVIGVFYALARKQRKEIQWAHMYLLAFLGLLTHLTSDWMNTWGTGLLEPWVNSRYSLGFLPIIDLVILSLFLVGFILRKKLGTQKAFRIVWALILVYIGSQGIQNLMIHHKVDQQFDQAVVSASFVPTQFTVIGKRGNELAVYSRSLWHEGKKTSILSTGDSGVVGKVLADPYAKTIAWWAPFYAITVDKSGKQATIFDPRFYRKGSSFINTSIKILGD